MLSCERKKEDNGENEVLFVLFTREKCDCHSPPPLHVTLTTVHSFDVNLEFLRLTELSAAKVTQWSCALRVGRTAVRAVHIQVVEAEKELQSDNPKSGELSHRPNITT